MQRSAVSRAYYASFLVAREYVHGRGLLAHPPTGKRWGSHERVIFSVGMLRQPGARRIRKALFRLKKQRVNADYDLVYAIRRTDVLKAIQDAEMVIAWIDHLP